MLGPILCGLLAEAPLLPKLRGHFAEFLNNASPAGLRILSSSTCVGLWYGYHMNNSGFSRYMAHMLHYSFSFRFTSLDCVMGFPLTLLFRLHQSFLSWLIFSTYVPTVLSYHSAGISTCSPSTTSFDLALGPDLPRADQLYPGNLGYSAQGIPTPVSLLIPASSLPACPPHLAVRLRPDGHAPLPCTYVHPRLRWHVSAPYIFGAGPLGQ